jgi:exonuclease SbcC
MRLRSLTLRNFRVYADETIDFGTGLIGIVGNNGAGKSSIVEAICLALYGTREVLSGKRPPRREGCPDGEDYEVSLTVDITGDQYTVSRYGNKPSRLQRGSEKAITGEKRVNAELQRLLGLSFDGFKTAFVALQGELNTLARHSSEPRRQLVCDMLGITRIDDAHGLAVKHRNDLQRDLRHLQLAIADLPKARRDLETAERTIADKTTELTTTRATHAAVSSEVVRATAIIDLITAIEQQAEKIGALEKQRQETESLGGRIQQLRDQLAVESTLRDEHALFDAGDPTESVGDRADVRRGATNRCRTRTLRVDPARGHGPESLRRVR